MDLFNTFVTFVIQHWVLGTLFFVLLLAFIVNEAVQHSFGMPNISPQEAIQLINHKNAVVFDIRPDLAFASGHIVGAMHLPSTIIEAKLNTLKKYAKDPVVVVCATGQESLKVAQKLKTHGFTHVCLMRGGLNEWKQANLPLVKR